MMIKKWFYDTRIIFTVLQVLALLALAAGTLMMVWLDILGISTLFHCFSGANGELIPFAIIGLLTVALVSILCYIALISFFNLCGRLKKGTAFTVQNTRAMKRIALCSLGVGLCLLFSDGLVYLTSVLVLGDPNHHLIDVYLVGLAMIFILVALVVWTLYLLLDRATAIQQENDLTI